MVFPRCLFFYSQSRQQETQQGRICLRNIRLSDWPLGGAARTPADGQFRHRHLKNSRLSSIRSAFPAK